MEGAGVSPLVGPWMTRAPNARAKHQTRRQDKCKPPNLGATSRSTTTSGRSIESRRHANALWSIPEPRRPRSPTTWYILPGVPTRAGAGVSPTVGAGATRHQGPMNKHIEWAHGVRIYVRHANIIRHHPDSGLRQGHKFAALTHCPGWNMTRTEMA